MHLASLCISWSLTSQEKKAFWKKKTIVDHSPWSKGRLLVHAFWVKLFHLKKTRCHCELWYSATTRHWAVEITLVANDWFQCWHEARRQVTILQQDLPFSDKNRHWSIWLYLLVVTKAAIPPLWCSARRIFRMPWRRTESISATSLRRESQKITVIEHSSRNLLHFFNLLHPEMPRKLIKQPRRKDPFAGLGSFINTSNGLERWEDMTRGMFIR